MMFRKYRGLKQIELAAQAGIGRAFLSQIESGTRNASVKMLKALAEALDVTMDMLV